jgi:hypothetical protein
VARRTFFSFHYKPDVTRANVVKNCWVTQDREDAGFFDSSAFERAQRTNDDALKTFLNKEMDGSSVVCALVGAETAKRRWVRYEIQRGIWETKGLLGVRVHSIKNLQQQITFAGPNPFDLLGVYTENQSIYLIERPSIADQWSYSSDFSKKVIPKFPYAGANLPAAGSHALSEFFPIYDWVTDSHTKIGSWIEGAAQKAGR